MLSPTSPCRHCRPSNSHQRGREVVNLLGKPKRGHHPDKKIARAAIRLSTYIFVGKGSDLVALLAGTRKLATLKPEADRVLGLLLLVIVPAGSTATL